MFAVKVTYQLLTSITCTSVSSRRLATSPINRTNPTMHQHHIPQCTILYQKNVHISVTKWYTVWYLSDTLLEMGLLVPCNECCQVSATRRSATRKFHDDVIKLRHFPRYWPFVRGIHRSPVNSPHNGQWRGALMFSLICARINRWANNRQAGD